MKSSSSSSSTNSSSNIVFSWRSSFIWAIVVIVFFLLLMMHCFFFIDYWISIRRHWRTAMRRRQSGGCTRWRTHRYVHICTSLLDLERLIDVYWIVLYCAVMHGMVWYVLAYLPYRALSYVVFPAGYSMQEEISASVLSIMWKEIIGKTPSKGPYYTIA